MTGAAYYIRFSELVELLGEADAVKLVQAKGGSKFYVRERILKTNHLVAAVGMEIAQKLADYVATGIGGLVVEIPVASSSATWLLNKRLRERILAGAGTEAELAKEFGIHGRTVRRMRRRIREEANLPPLETLLALPAPGQ